MKSLSIVLSMALSLPVTIALQASAKASMMDQFDCGSEELSILITMDPNRPDKITVHYDGGEMINASIVNSGGKLVHDMVRIPTASGEAYAGYGKTFHAKGANATFESDGATTICKMVGGEPHQMQTHADGAVGGAEKTVNAVGRSLGGKLRDGPGMNFRQIGSLREGDWLTLVTDTGVMMDGYPWFEVALDNGTRGYQWGGILCSNGVHMAGVFEACR